MFTVLAVELKLVKKAIVQVFIHPTTSSYTLAMFTVLAVELKLAEEALAQVYTHPTTSSHISKT